MGQSFVSHDTTPGVTATNDNSTSSAGPGLLAQSAAAGVMGESTTWHGVYGTTQSTTGGIGVMGESAQSEGVRGVSHAPTHGGVVGINDNPTDGAGPGLYGASRGTGVWGVSQTWNGVYGETASTTGGNGVHGKSTGSGAGLYGESASGVGVYGKGGKLAALFEGDVEVTGDIRLTGADCAEEFAVADAASAEPGTVMVLDDHENLSPSQSAYDRRVVGVVSGAGLYKPGIVLDGAHGGVNRSRIGLLGKVFCKVDADIAPVEVGDLLTTSETPGYAMKALDPERSFGAVLGKALKPLKSGQELIPILVALQ